MTYPPTGDPNQPPYYGPPSGGYPPPTPPGGFPPQTPPGGFPPQTPPGGFPPPQAPPTQGWAQQPATQGWQAPPTQGWQPPGAPPPAPPRGTTPWVPIAVIAGVLVLAVIGGVLVFTKVFGGDDTETPGPLSQPGVTAGAPTTGAARTTDKPTSKSSSASTTPAKYKAPGDLCSSDLSALGAYSAKQEKATPNVRNTGGIARSDCDFDLRTAGGMKVTFGIKTQVYTTSKEAKQYFDSGFDMDRKRYFDAELSGIGERAYGTNRDWDIGSKTSDYTIRVLDANLYVSISLVTFGNAFVPKDELKPKAVEEVRAIIAKLPTA